MKNTYKEKLLDDYPIPISIDCTKVILEQMEKCIFKIKNKKGKGTGFFCLISYKKKKYPVMITCNHVLDEGLLKESKELIISLNNEKETIDIKIDENRMIYTDKDRFDITIIEIKKNDKIFNYLELDEKIFEENPNIYNENIYIAQYPELKYGRQIAAVSYGILREIEENGNIMHLCSTRPGSSGSPILNISNNKVLGIHKESSKDFNFKCGTYLTKPINEYLNCLNKSNLLKKSKIKNNDINDEAKNEINIILKIEKEDINKNIYYLDNTDGSYNCNGTYMTLKHDRLKELNELNVELTINKIKSKYKKYFRPESEGLYEIHLKFNTFIKDCSFMFSGCKNIIKINLSDFNTKNTNNMSCMFSGCELIEDLDLSSFQTKNVTNMSYMFYDCKRIKNLDLSSFDTKNVTNMSCMFSGCNNMINLIISSFDTTNVTNMNGMFCECKNLENLDLSSFDTKNVTDMSGMFLSCKKIIDLNLCKFNTKKVTNMSGIFHSCKNVIRLNLSSFDTKKVSNMKDIFFGCKNLSQIKINKEYNKLLISELSREENETEIINNE